MEQETLLDRLHRFFLGEHSEVVIPDITLKEGTLPFAPEDFDPMVYPEQAGYRGFHTGWGDGVCIGDVVKVGGERLRFLGRDEKTGMYFYKTEPTEPPHK